MDAADNIFQTTLFDEGCEVVQDTGNIIYLQTESDINASLVFLFQFTNLIAVARIVFAADGKIVCKGYRSVPAEA